MTFDTIYEKQGDPTSATETAEVDDDTSASVRSRPRSTVSTESESVLSHSNSSTDKTRYRLRTPSVFFQDSRFTVEGVEHGRNSFNSTRSRPRNGDARRVVALDRDNPGGWVIDHHRDNLIIELDEPQVGVFSSAFQAFWGRVWGMRGGRKETLLPSSSVSSTSTDKKRFQINFAEVQRMRIRKLQCELVRHVVEMRTDGSESSGWEETLEKYIKALQDHDFMENRSNSIRDPFLATGEYAIDNYVLNRNIDRDLAEAKDMRKIKSPRPWESLDSGRDHEPICGTRTGNVARTWLRGFKERVVLAAAGGAFLIGPMWLMVLNRGLYTSLISTTAFVAAFGLLMAYFLDEGKDNPAVAEEAEDGCELDMISLASSTASLSESIIEYRRIHGRTYTQKVDYWGPNDERQNFGLDIKVLDLGTGTGTWAIDFADEFPSAEVIGVDVSPIQPTWTPPNCVFQMDDIEQPWTWEANHFDFIHIRNLEGCIGNWTNLYRQAFQCLAPGGYIEIKEFDIEIRSQTHYDLGDDHPFKTYSKTLIGAAEKLGKVGVQCRDRGIAKSLEAAGFVGIVEKKWAIPVGPWAKDPVLRDVGTGSLDYLDQSLEGFVTFLLKEVMGWQDADVLVFVARFRQAIKDYRLQPFFDLHLVYARKPEAVKTTT
ncbi:putative SAM dependent methyltransferase [Colletotrichum karsti]|uniref:SAM dependent methyltransferase n=1 Tax=Colletotrichum karsti TaxID=1095194 RepID=A0A9P6LKA9_9PEZI|nr:putative SAM dependent methyltransferase [Colletotrichum karsti]KAF9876553.1 putative SAM dependent methyltransferase [Colletotrichum karsti]